jgi:hypothetical protein
MFGTPSLIDQLEAFFHVDSALELFGWAALAFGSYVAVM